eukprot:TRINITY_DN2577_c0_g1_i3.p2 TRINITY_DN2577_c0_g1~~TRINITY_DN2577_c0_g1_i3.p2  ORF type:complete len:116 (+),score=0.85 TRINITY_DN2577_c0_g1_i3:760-1107(+)
MLKYLYHVRGAREHPTHNDAHNIECCYRVGAVTPHLAWSTPNKNNVKLNRPECLINWDQWQCLFKLPISVPESCPAQLPISILVDTKMYGKAFMYCSLSIFNLPSEVRARRSAPL